MTQDHEQRQEIEQQKSAPASERNTPLPKEHLSFNESLAETWIAEEPDPQFQGIKRQLAENVALVPYETFHASLQRCTEQLNQQIEGKQYAVLWDSKPHSSKRWVYEQVKDNISTPPTAETYFGNYDTFENYESFREILDQGVDTFVVMDDAIYSGEQFRNLTLKQLIDVYKRFGYYPPRMPKVVLVAPFMTNKFKNNEATVTAQQQGIVTIITEQTMPSVGEVLTEQQKAALASRENVLDLPEQRKERDQLDPNDDQVVLDATLTAFDHRVADAHSFCEPIAHRFNLHAKKPYGDETTEYFKKEAEEYQQYQSKRVARGRELKAQA